MGDNPTTAFALAVIGVVFHVIGGFTVGAISTFVALFTFGLGFIGTLLAILFVLLAIVGAAMIYSPGTVRGGSFLTLFVAIFSFATVWGLFIGSILSLVAAILGLAWKPSTLQPQQSGKFCSKCGAQLSIEAKFCPKCGSKID